MTHANPQLCLACGYDLAGLPASGACPECGFSVAVSLDEGAREVVRQRRLRRAARLAAASIVLLTALSAASFFMPIGFPFEYKMLALTMRGLAAFALAGLIIACWRFVAMDRTLLASALRFLSTASGVFFVLNSGVESYRLLAESHSPDTRSADLWRWFLPSLVYCLMLISLIAILRRLLPATLFVRIVAIALVGSCILQMLGHSAYFVVAVRTSAAELFGLAPRLNYAVYVMDALYHVSMIALLVLLLTARFTPLALLRSASIASTPSDPAADTPPPR